VLSQLFQIYLLADAIYARNSIQLVAFLFFHVSGFIYSILQIFQLQQIKDDYVKGHHADGDDTDLFAKISVFVITGCVVIGVSNLGVAVCAWAMFRDFDWDIYKKLGASLAVKRMYKTYHILVALLKLCAFFFLGFVLQFMILVLSSVDIEKGLTIAAIPIMLVVLVVGGYATRNEIKEVMVGFIVALCLVLAYFVFKTVRIHTDPDRVQKYYGVGNYLTAFAVISGIVCLDTIYHGVLCFGNFGKGLKAIFHARDAAAEKRQPIDDEDLVESPKFARPISADAIKRLEDTPQQVYF